MKSNGLAGPNDNKLTEAVLGDDTSTGRLSQLSGACGKRHLVPIACVLIFNQTGWESCCWSASTICCLLVS